MSKGHVIAFGNGATCTVELESASTQPGSDPQLTVSSYSVNGLSRGDLSISVTRTQMPAIVKVEFVDRGTCLGMAELEQIRKAAEGVFRAQNQ